MSPENMLTLPCCECGTELHEDQMFEYGGTVACEKCVTEYEKNKLRAVPELKNEAAAMLVREVETRRRNAVVWLQRNRKTLEKHAAKRAAQR